MSHLILITSLTIFSVILRQYRYIGSLDITIPRYNYIDLIPLLPWHIVISGFHCIIFSASAPSGPNLFSITGTKVMTSGIAFDRPNSLNRLLSLQNLYDRPDRPNRTQLYPSDRGRLRSSG